VLVDSWGLGGGMENLVKQWAVAALTAVALSTAAAGAADEQPRAAEQQGPQPSSRGKRTVLHFDDDSIRGDITRPDGELVQAPRKVSESSLLRIRQSFMDRALAGAARGR